LNVEQYPHLPMAQVATTASTDYLSLLSEDLVHQARQTSDEVLHLEWDQLAEPLSEVRN
jgi:hypothetical protein